VSDEPEVPEEDEEDLDDDEPENVVLEVQDGIMGSHSDL
jgi:hypothetical protein